MNRNPEIYVADLAAYNNGDLIGRWIDATLDPEDILAEIQDMLEQGEEWAIHDTDDLGVEIREHTDLNTVSMLGNLVFDLGDPFVALYNYDPWLADDYDNWKQLVEDGYLGRYDSMREYAEQYVDELGLFDNDILSTYFNYDAFARDLEHNYVVTDANPGVHIFLP